MREYTVPLLSSESGSKNAIDLYHRKIADYLAKVRNFIFMAISLNSAILILVVNLNKLCFYVHADDSSTVGIFPKVTSMKDHTNLIYNKVGIFSRIMP